MRKIGTLDNKKQIKSFQSYLYYHGIESHNYYDENDLNLWVLRDEKIEEAKAYLEKFKSGQSSEIEQQIKEGQKKILEENQKEKEKDKKRKFIDARTSVFTSNKFKLASITGSLLSFSVLVFLIIEVGQARIIFEKLSFTFYSRPHFYEISQGEIWRFITPIFLHGSFWHILFNMSVLFQIGPIIENKEKPFFFAILVFLIAFVSNTLFYILVGPGMIGMSGVLFGLIAYGWAYYRVAPNTTQYFPIQTYGRSLVLWSLICFALKMTGLMNIANVVHSVGALTGLCLGFLKAFLSKENAVPLKWIFQNKEIRSAIILVILLTIFSVYIDKGLLQLTF